MLEFGNREVDWTSLHTQYREVSDPNFIFEKHQLKTRDYLQNTISNGLALIDEKLKFVTRGIFRWYYYPTEHNIDLLGLNIHPLLPIMCITKPNEVLAFDIQAQRFIEPYRCKDIGTLSKAIWRPCDGYSLTAIGRTGIALFKTAIEYEKSTPEDHYAAFSSIVPWFRVIPLPLNGQVTAAAWSIDGKTLALGVYGNSNVFLLDINFNKWSILSYRGSAPCQLKFSPNNLFLAVGDFSGSLILFDTNDDSHRSWTGFHSSVLSLEWSKDSKLLIFNNKHSSNLQMIKTERFSLDAFVLLSSFDLCPLKLDPFSVHVGGAIRNIRLHPNSQYLAVSFEPEDDEFSEEEINRVKLTSVPFNYNTPLKNTTTPKKTTIRTYPGTNTPRKTGNFATPASPLVGHEEQSNTKEGRTKIAIFCVEFKNGKQLCQVM